MKIDYVNFLTTERTEITEEEDPGSLTGKIIGAAIVEIKSVSSLAPIHDAQLLPYLKLSNYKIGLLINFNARILKEGIRRLRT